MRVPVVGKIEMVSTTVVAHGMMHEKEESTVDRFVLGGWVTLRDLLLTFPTDTRYLMIRGRGILAHYL
jgi:hypothetical protein